MLRSDLDNIDAHEDFDWLVARKTLEEAELWVAAGDRLVLDVHRQRDLVDLQRTLDYGGEGGTRALPQNVTIIPCIFVKAITAK